MKKILSLVAAALLAAVTGARAADVEKVADFNPELGEFPEGIAVDRNGNVYLSLIGNSSIKRVTPDGFASTFAQISDRPILGMKFDRVGNLYVAAGQGIWKVTPLGIARLFSEVPGHGLLNDLAFDKKGNLYVADSFACVVWRINSAGDATVWSADALLSPKETFFPLPLGPNGIEFNPATESLIVNITRAGRVVEIPVQADGSAAPAELVAEDDALIGADGLALDTRGNMYLCANIQHQIVYVTREGDIQVLAEGGLLSSPTALAFGRAANQKSLFIANNALFFNATHAEPIPGPGLLKLTVGVPGRPLP